ncbi:hypothetical protein Pcinc_015146 [Petrolisthes cinctipes]|uniref:Uncharacterized protein n=1 Tax=Petrolisthes cinctipes TaxID=88211 RepID=A0AAE1FU20_PETCI|nr:hypothetical protein Pcinc_015146 [Petrolisthes cinctipes]
MKESGLLDIWLEGQITNTSQCLKPPSTDRSTSDIAALGLQSFFGPLIVLLSAVTNFEEMGAKSKKKKNWRQAWRTAGPPQGQPKRFSEPVMSTSSADSVEPGDGDST